MSFTRNPNTPKLPHPNCGSCQQLIQTVVFPPTPTILSFPSVGARGLNPGPYICKAQTLPLSYTPGLPRHYILTFAPSDNQYTFLVQLSQGIRVISEEVQGDSVTELYRDLFAAELGMW